MKGWRQAASLTPTEAAAIVGMSRSAFYLQVHTGHVPTFRDARGIQRVRPADLAAYIGGDHTPDAQAPAQASLFDLPTVGVPLC